MALIALLDANVLWPAALRCTLIRAAIRDLYRPAWTEKILDEMGKSLVREAGLDPQRVARTVQLMRDNCPHLLVGGYEDLIPVMRNDPKDRHVLAAAVRVGADVIVTSNTGHFPADAREPYSIDLQTPDQFLCDLWSTSPETIARVLVEQARSLTRPQKTVFEVAQNLGRTVPLFARMALSSEILSRIWEQPEGEMPVPAYRPLQLGRPHGEYTPESAQELRSARVEFEATGKKVSQVLREAVLAYLERGASQPLLGVGAHIGIGTVGGHFNAVFTLRNSVVTRSGLADHTERLVTTRQRDTTWPVG